MRNLLICSMLSITCCWADAGQIERLLRSTLSDTPHGEAVNTEEIRSQIYDSGETLTSSEVESLLPLAMQCRRSSRFQARSAGLSMFISITLRQDSSKMIEPYVETLGNLLDGPTGPYRRGVLVILTMTKPEISLKAIATLEAHLEDNHSSAEESSGIVWALITSATSNQVIRHNVLKYVTKQSNAKITSSALHALHLVRPPDAEALDFFGKGLDSDSPSVRDSAVDVIRGLDRECALNSRHNSVASQAILRSEKKCAPERQQLYVTVDVDKIPRTRPALQAIIKIHGALLLMALL